jgi:hypothetical protein
VSISGLSQEKLSEKLATQSLLSQEIFTKTLLFECRVILNEDCTLNKKSPLSAFLTVILIGGLILAHAPAEVGGILKPLVPEFTVKLIDPFCDTSTTYSIDPCTGKNVIDEGFRDLGSEQTVFSPEREYSSTEGLRLTAEVQV